MAKPYSQDLRDRVIDAVKRGEMSRRAAARRYEISESVAIKWLERVERDGSREPERDAQTAADLARAQQLAEEARQLMRALFRPRRSADRPQNREP
jgi:transposase